MQLSTLGYHKHSQAHTQWGKSSTNFPMSRAQFHYQGFIPSANPYNCGHNFTLLAVLFLQIQLIITNVNVDAYMCR